MMSNVYPQWDIPTIIFYVILAYIGVYCIKKGQYVSYPHFHRVNSKVVVNSYYVLWWLIWTLAATFRLINANGVGGTDAWTYINYFQIANNTSFSNTDDIILKYALHYEPLWKYYTEFIRLFTDNYKVFLFITYGFIVYSYQKFIKGFEFEKVYAAPFICLFFVYLRGFNTLRTNVAAAFILLMTLALKDEKYKKAIILGICSVGMQVSSALYCLFIPFYWFYKKGVLNKYKVFLLLIVSIVIGKVTQKLLTGNLGLLMGHSYASYASHNIGKSFMDNFWKVAFTQILIGIMLFLFDKKIKKRIAVGNNISKSLLFLRTVCIFDVVTIPITFVLDIWRGYEYFYVARLMMWSVITDIVLRKQLSGTRKLIIALEFVIFTAWLIFRIYSTYKGSGYVPYVISIFD